MSELIRSLQHENIREQSDSVPVDELRPGDTVRVHFRIVEGNRERLQPFQGTVIRIRHGGGASASITVRRTGAHGVGVERTFPLYSPRLEKVDLLRHAHVRRSKLYFLRERTGKRARLRDKRLRRAEQTDSSADSEQGSDD
jgi:large subunit ribosomal protein L19